MIEWTIEWAVGRREQEAEVGKATTTCPVMLGVRFSASVRQG